MYNRKETIAVLGRTVRTYRESMFLSQSELAEKLGCSWRLINHLERGVCLPDFVTVLNILDYLNIDLVYLYKALREKVNGDTNKMYLIKEIQSLIEKLGAEELTLLQTFLEMLKDYKKDCRPPKTKS